MLSVYPLGSDRILGVLQSGAGPDYFAIFDTSGTLVRTVPLQLPGHDSFRLSEEIVRAALDQAGEL